jgi:hypothetical protein
MVEARRILPLTELEYELLEECKCGPEPIFVLVSSCEWEKVSEVEKFICALVGLFERGLLASSSLAPRGSVLSPAETIREYFTTRVAAGESLDEPPEVVGEITFTTTEEGLACLLPEDRPVPLDRHV